MQAVLHKAFREYVDANGGADQWVKARRLLDIDSTYRDRTLYPLPSSFEIPMYFGAKPKSVYNSQDPISQAWPVEFNATFGANSAPGATTATLNSASSNIPHQYNNMLLQIEHGTLAPDYYTIIRYDSVTKVVTLDQPLVAGIVSGITTYSIRPAKPTVRNQLSGATSTTKVTIPLAFYNAAYKGQYFRMVTGPAANSYSLISDIQKVGGPPPTAVEITLSSPLSALPVATNVFEICSFTRDNVQPLIYNGTSTLNSQVCYNVTFIGISIPNVILKNGYRTYPGNYPYFYVHLYNSNPKVGGTNLYSNNPNSELASFKVITYLSRSDNNFLIYVVPEIQTIAFKIDQALYFSLTLPNGEPVEFETPDYASPQIPNPLLQISATFQVERLT